MSGWFPSITIVLSIYCVLVLLASLAGGWLLLAMRLTHARLQLAVSFVAGLMLGVALLHFIPDSAERSHSLDQTVHWVLAGFLSMFFLQQFFHRHHHDVQKARPKSMTTTWSCLPLTGPAISRPATPTPWPSTPPPNSPGRRPP